MFEPRDIVDPADKFLEDKGGAPLVAAVAAVQRNRCRINRALWMTGGALCTLGTLIFAISLGPWGDTQKLSVETGQSASHRGVEKTPQASKVERPSTTPSLAQSPKAEPEEVGSAVQTAQQQTHKPPAPGSTSHQMVEGEISAAPGGVSSATPQKASPVADPTQADPGPEAIKEKPESTEERLRVTSAASIHSRPSDAAEIVGTAYPDAEGVVAARKPDWVQIADPKTGKTGWIRSAFLAPVSEDAASTETALPEEQDLEPSDEALSATVEPEPRAKAKKHASKPRYGRRPLRRLRSVLRRFR